MVQLLRTILPNPWAPGVCGSGSLNHVLCSVESSLTYRSSSTSCAPTHLLLPPPCTGCLQFKRAISVFHLGARS